MAARKVLMVIIFIFFEEHEVVGFEIRSEVAAAVGCPDTNLSHNPTISATHP
jgi:hypothetical protein